jgi:hypothetical protein
MFLIEVPFKGGHEWFFHYGSGVNYTACTLGWVDFGTRTKVPLEVYNIPFKSSENKRKSVLTQ